MEGLEASRNDIQYQLAFTRVQERCLEMSDLNESLDSILRKYDSGNGALTFSSDEQETQVKWDIVKMGEHCEGDIKVATHCYHLEA